MTICIYPNDLYLLLTFVGGVCLFAGIAMGWHNGFHSGWLKGILRG